MAKDFLSDVDFKDNLVTLTSTDAGSSAGPILELYRNSSSPADADYIGQIKFQGRHDGGAKALYAKITGKIGDASDGSEDGIIEIAHQKAGSNNISARFTSTALKLINGTGLEIADGLLTLGSTAVTSTAAELNILDGVTASTAELNIMDGVTATTAELNILDGCIANSGGLNALADITYGAVAANKAVTADGNLDVASFRNVTLTGELDAATLDISGNADIDGTTNLDDVDIDGNVQLDGTFTVGVNDTGYDVKFFGATASKYMLWDQSADSLIVKDTVDAVNFKVNGGQGSDGQVLTSTGSGVAWEDAAGGSSFADGSASAPSIKFTDQTDTGLFRTTEDDAGGTTVTVVGIATDGVVRATIGNDIADFKSQRIKTTDIIQANEFRASDDGPASDPSFTFVNDSDTGIYLKGTGELGIATGGVEHYWTAAGIYLASGDWFRTTGSAGWYNQTYQGGWYMVDTTYVTTYNNKGINVKGNIKLNAMATFSGSGYATARRQDSTGIFKELTSSERFKTDITDLSLEESMKVLDCRPILFRDKEEQAENPSSEMYAGISAESLQTAGYEWALKYDIDEDGNKTNTPRGIHYELLVTPLIKIIKDQKDKMADLETRVAALES